MVVIQNVAAFILKAKILFSNHQVGSLPKSIRDQVWLW